MKKIIALMLALSMVFTLCGCGKSENAKKAEELIKAIVEVTLDSEKQINEAQEFYDSLTEEEKAEVENYAALEGAVSHYEELVADAALTDLSSEKWININNGDEYHFTKEGTGKHDDTDITFTLEEETVAVVEGISSVQAKSFTWDRKSDIQRLIPEDENTYYVRESNYEEISQMVTDENIKILLSQEFWKASGATAYMQFLEGGYGWLVMVGNTIGMTWEMADNNTVKGHIDYGYESGQNIMLDIINDNGTYKLVAANGATYTPYNR